MSSIKEAMFNENEETFRITFDKKGKDKKVHFQLQDVNSRDAVLSEIASITGFSKTVQSESQTQPLLLNLLGVVLIPLGTWLMRGVAIDAQNGGHFETSGGRRSGLKQLFINLVESIGPTGVTIIGVIGFFYMAYITYKRYSNPASETVFN